MGPKIEEVNLSSREMLVEVLLRSLPEQQILSLF